MSSSARFQLNQVFLLVVVAFIWNLHGAKSLPYGPDKLKEDHHFKIQIDGQTNQQAVDGNYNLDLVRQDGTRQKITSNGPTVQGTYEYLDTNGQRHAVDYEASREGGFRIVNPQEAEGLREIPAKPLEDFQSGKLKVSESHASTLEFHRRTVEKAWRDQELHSVGASALKEKFGGGLINASLHREKDPNSNAVHSVFRKEFRDSSGRLRGFQQAHSIIHAVNASSLANGTAGNGPMMPIPFMGPPGGGGSPRDVSAGGPPGPMFGFNLGQIMSKIREFHQSLFGAGGPPGLGNGTEAGGPLPAVPPMLPPFMMMGDAPPPLMPGAALDGMPGPQDPAMMHVPEQRPPPV